MDDKKLSAGEVVRERAAFEAWLELAIGKGFIAEVDLARYDGDGGYRYNPAASSWAVWQARAALSQQPECKAQSQPSNRDDLHQLAFELGGTDGGEYLLDDDDLDALFLAAQRVGDDRIIIALDDLVMRDDYGVYGSDFYICKLCHAESGAGVLNKGIPHEPGCAVGNAEASAATNSHDHPQSPDAGAMVEALELLVLFSKPTKTNAVALNNAHRVIAACRAQGKGAEE